MRKQLLAGVVAAALALPLAGCGSSENQTACDLYADGYNNLENMLNAAVNGDTSITADDIQAQLRRLPSQFGDAFDKAQGDVAVKIRNSRDAALAFAVSSSDNNNAGMAFFVSAGEVEDACKADGAEIDLVDPDMT